jgi:hypothetical protein
MGYPFNKKLDMGDHSTIESLVESLPHTKITEFTIYRYIKERFSLEENEKIKNEDLVYAYQSWCEGLCEWASCQLIDLPQPEIV